MILRRLRGLLATIVGGALVGGVGGTVIGLLFLLVPGPKTTTIIPSFPGAIIIVPAIWGAVIGALSGTAFGLVLMLAERGRGVENLSASRIAIWAAVPSAAMLRFGGASWVLVTLGSILAATIGVSATLLAKRGREAVTTAEALPPQA